MTSYNDGLSEISQLLQAGAAAGDGKALQWAEVLDAALSSKVPLAQREAWLRVFYLLYGAQELPSVPQLRPLRRPGAAERVAENMDRLRISLPEALRQINSQRHPGAYLLLTCHLGRERPPACQNFPWLTLGGMLLLIGLFCGPSNRERVAVESRVSDEAFEPLRAAASEATAVPAVLAIVLLVCMRHLSSSRASEWTLLAAVGVSALCSSGQSGLKHKDLSTHADWEGLARCEDRNMTSDLAAGPERSTSGRPARPPGFTYVGICR
ncbi:unnamed protein product [Effrenium voratum]|nr:unnamed protein product [Effrenium voratum]